MCNLPRLLIIETLTSASLDTFTNVSASQPLSSTCRDRKCQFLSSVAASVNCSHLEMSMSKLQLGMKKARRTQSHCSSAWSTLIKDVFHKPMTSLIMTLLSSLHGLMFTPSVNRKAYQSALREKSLTFRIQLISKKY